MLDANDTGVEGDWNMQSLPFLGLLQGLGRVVTKRALKTGLGTF